MPNPASPSPAALRVVHKPWESPLIFPDMSNTTDRHERFRVTRHYMEVDGKPAIPVSGELHYSRVPRAKWEERLRLIKAGGIMVVATYTFWIHHERTEGKVSFDDGLDVAAFVRLCAEVGLDVVLRVGPWCHGEVRNGGFPDWVQQAPVQHRTNDPAYLELVKRWFGYLGEELAGLLGPGSNVVGIQLENELYDQPDHITELKKIARNAGLTAPVWTATAWGGAELPDGDVLPLFGGYGDGFWVDADAPWDPTFREHYFFGHVWDDPGIGADVREQLGTDAGAAAPRTPSPLFPPATCELAGGMATAYQRRPWPRSLDVAAVAHNKIGNGSAWQGYYMFAGGMNPADGLQESPTPATPKTSPGSTTTSTPRSEHPAAWRPASPPSGSSTPSWPLSGSGSRRCRPASRSRRPPVLMTPKPCAGRCAATEAQASYSLPGTSRTSRWAPTAGHSLR